MDGGVTKALGGVFAKQKARANEIAKDGNFIRPSPRPVPFAAFCPQNSAWYSF